MKGSSRKRKPLINKGQMLTGLLTGVILKILDIILRKFLNL